MSDKYILDEEGQVQAEPDLLKWGMWYEHAHESKGKDSLIVQQDHIGEVLVSTVFLALDQRFPTIPGPPVLWETMILGGEHDGWQERYTSRDEALAGHQEALRILKGER